MKNEYNFRRCRKTDISGVSNLYRVVFGTDRTREYWEWKYFSNPAGAAFSILALYNDKVVGQIGAIPIRFSIGGHEFIVSQELDVAVFEENRRFDLLLKMYAKKKEVYIKENVHFSMGFTIDAVSEIDQLLKIKKKLCPIPRLIKVLDIEPLLNKKGTNRTISKLISPIANTALYWRYPHKMSTPAGTELKRIQHFDDRFDSLWDKIKSDYPVMAVKDSVYLNWRYANAVHTKHSIFCMQREPTKEVLGFIALGTNHQDIPRGHIYDIVTVRQGDPAIVECLIRYAIRFFREQGVSAINCWMFPHSHIYRELKKTGFVEREKKGRDVVIYQNKTAQDLTNFKKDYFSDKRNWHIAKGDSDID